MVATCDRYVKGAIGVNWTHGGGTLDVGMSITSGDAKTTGRMVDGHGLDVTHANVKNNSSTMGGMPHGSADDFGNKTSGTIAIHRSNNDENHVI